jgi:hypothetical protein
MVNKSQKNQTQIFVIYDGINNSVFEGQVLNPFKEEADNNPQNKFIILSFDSAFSNINNINYSLPANLTIIKNRRLPFLGKLSLILSTIKLQKLLSKLNSNYTLKARGPLAGWLCLNTNNAELLVQARGILVEEYKMAHQKSKNPIKNLFHTWRSNQLRKIEKEVYSNKKVHIESVSTALKEYLITNYHTHKNRIFISQKDIPKSISVEQKIKWSKDIREKLNVPNNYEIYCYNGSAKVWQCPKETVSFFTEKLKTNSNIFLLILTQNKDTFTALLKDIPSTHYKILCVNHHEVSKYLSACNYGLLFREKNIVNWVSRPTKALEYKAAHLKIIHNDTIEYLTTS